MADIFWCQIQVQAAQGWRNRTLISHERAIVHFLVLPASLFSITAVISVIVDVFYYKIEAMTLIIKVIKILYNLSLLLDQLRFCETHFTTYQRFVDDQSAISA